MPLRIRRPARVAAGRVDLASWTGRARVERGEERLDGGVVIAAANRAERLVEFESSQGGIRRSARNRRRAAIGVMNLLAVGQTNPWKQTERVHIRRCADLVIVPMLFLEAPAEQGCRRRGRHNPRGRTRARTEPK